MSLPSSDAPGAMIRDVRLRRLSQSLAVGRDPDDVVDAGGTARLAAADYATRITTEAPRLGGQAIIQSHGEGPKLSSSTFSVVSTL